MVAFQLWPTPSNPPGYHRDEASVSLNAHTLATSLRDEDGNVLPVALRAFDDHRSALFSYLLAGVFLATGPDPHVARGLSAVLVLTAILLVGLLARRVTSSTPVAVGIVVLGCLTPWLYELGRIAHEVSTQLALLALLLLALERTWREQRFTSARGAVVGLLLALLVYSYTGNRLLGPLLAAALLVFASRDRRAWLLAAWGTFLALLVPLGIHGLRHPGSLTARYDATSFARDGASRPRLVLRAVGNWLQDVNPWHWATAGDPDPYIHNGGYGSVLAAAAVLALAGVGIVLVRRSRDLWWRYVLVAALLVPVPAAVTIDRANAIRLSALPLLLLVLAIPSLQWLVGAASRGWAGRVAAVVLALTVTVQLVQFQDAFRTRGPSRLLLYEAGVPALLEHGFEVAGTLYVDFDDRRAQAHARWYAAANGLPDDRVVILPDGGAPPAGAAVFGLFQECDFECQEFARWEEYWLARAIGS